MAMARAKDVIQAERPLYERDFCLWVEEQVRLLKEGQLEQLDLVNPIEEIGDLGIGEEKAVKSNLVVVLQHLLKYEFRHRRRIEDEIEESSSLAGYSAEVFERCYLRARGQAAAETALPPETFPAEPPFTLAQALDPKFLPD
jgi:hypothetical protein